MFLKKTCSIYGDGAARHVCRYLHRRKKEGGQAHQDRASLFARGFVKRSHFTISSPFAAVSARRVSALRDQLPRLPWRRSSDSIVPTRYLRYPSYPLERNVGKLIIQIGVIAVYLYIELVELSVVLFFEIFHVSLSFLRAGVSVILIDISVPP